MYCIEAALMFRLNFKVAVVALLLIFFVQKAAHVEAQTMRPVGMLPADCRQLLAADQRGTFQDWTAFVALEHCDRIKRLRRISESLPEYEQPHFYETYISSMDYSGRPGPDIPVLRVVFPERTFFDTGSSELRPEAVEIARLVAENLRREPPDVALFVAGHADARGARDLNEALSVDRANSIADRIFRFGVNLTSIWRIGFGKDMPLHAGLTDEAHSMNRRIEFLFAAKPLAMAAWLADNQLDDLCQGRNRTEIDECKKRLNFQDNYVLRRVNVNEDPPTRGPQVKKAVGVGARTVSPQAGRARSVDPAKSQLRNVTPKTAATISINPKGRSFGNVVLKL